MKLLQDVSASSSGHPPIPQQSHFHTKRWTQRKDHRVSNTNLGEQFRPHPNIPPIAGLAIVHYCSLFTLLSTSTLGHLELRKSLVWLYHRFFHLFSGLKPPSRLRSHCFLYWHLWPVMSDEHSVAWEMSCSMQNDQQIHGINWLEVEFKLV